MINWVKSLFKKKVQEGLYNIHHPEMAEKTEFAFEAGGTKYYRMKKDVLMPVGRYKWVDATLNEVDIRMTLPVLKAYIKELKTNLDGSKGVINLSKAFQQIYAMETRCDLAFEPETVRRLASVVYFDETEDLRDYDQEYAEKKIEFWQKKKTYAIFMTAPIGELLNLSEHSETSLVTYIKEAGQILKDLTFEQENQS
jgi:hypothetical protein